jgi:uncharacterized membrane protein YjfL (UPF0719 family)
MNSKLTLLAVIEILSALSMGIVILAATYQFLKYWGKKKYNIEHDNMAFGIFKATVLFAVGLTMTSVIQPLLSLFRIFASRDMGNFELAWKFFLYGGIYIAMGFVFAVIICASGIFLYTLITPIDEFAELKNNNIAVALIVGSIIITLSLLTNNGVTLLIESFIPYPQQYPK